MSIPRIFQIKRRLANSPDGGGVAGVTLAEGELAYNEVDDTLYYNGSTGVTAIAGPGVLLTRSTAQTVSGDKTFSGAIDFTSSLSAVAVTPLVDTGDTTVATTQFVQNVFSYIDGGNFDGVGSGIGKYFDYQNIVTGIKVWLQLNLWKDETYTAATSFPNYNINVVYGADDNNGYNQADDSSYTYIDLDNPNWAQPGSINIPSSIDVFHIKVQSSNGVVFNPSIVNPNNKVGLITFNGNSYYTNP
jgi:hypothetical protein